MGRKTERTSQESLSHLAAEASDKGHHLPPGPKNKDLGISDLYFSTKFLFPNILQARTLALVIDPGEDHLTRKYNVTSKS